MSYKIKQSFYRVINDANDIRVLEANPVAGTLPSIGEGTSFDDFDGWTATNFVKIHPFADAFRASQLVSFSKQSVKANAIPFATGGAVPNDGTDFQTTTTIGIVQNPLTVVTNTIACRERPQISTLTIGTLPAVGSYIRALFSYREIARDLTGFVMGTNNHPLDFRIKTGDTPTIVATRIKQRLEEIAQGADSGIANAVGGKDFYLNQLSITQAGAVLTINFGRVGFEFTISTVPVESTNGQTELPSTLAFDTVTYGFSAKPFRGVLNYKWMQKYVQNNSGLFDLNNGSTKFLPIDGVYYTQYNIVYRHTSIDESQPSTINAVQQHDVELELYINPALTGVITKLDLIGV